MGREAASESSSGKRAALADQAAVQELCARLLLAMEGSPPPQPDREESTPGQTHRRGVFVFSSPARGQGTSSVAAAVAGVLARSGKRTVLAMAGPEGEAGTGGVTLQENLAAGGVLSFEDPPLARLQVPDSFLALPEEARAPQRWVKEFDVMIVDAPAMPEFVTRYWVPLAQAVVLVVDGERTSVRSVTEVRDEIAVLGGTLAGVVLNRYRSRVPRFLHG